MEPKLTARMHSRAPAVAAMLLAFLATLVLAPSMAMAQGAEGVMATFIDYNAPPNWDLRASSASCAAVDGDKPFWWREYYWWAAFCDPSVPHARNAACGLCVLVTNAATGTAMKVRIVDDCGDVDGGVVIGIDSAASFLIDTDGRGRAAGQLEVNYQFVSCEG